MEQSRVRIVDIAEALGLSTATVSNVIHGKTEKISSETVKRVQLELERTGYIPNMAGILLARNNSRIIGVVLNDHAKYEGRGLEDGFNRGYSTLKKLVEMGMKDVGFGMTVQDLNAKDLVALYDLSNEMNMEFATASLHNSFYFVEAKNIIHDRPMVAKEFERLINELLKSKSPKKWFRAYFNHGLINYIYGQKRLLPCDMAFDTFFIDPYGDVMPCNGTKDKEVMGNLNECESWDELWQSPRAQAVRSKVRCCDRNCWMIGSVSPAMHKYIWVPVFWVLRHKLKFWTKQKYSMYENKIVRDYRDGKVSKEELDACSTCDLHAMANDGLSQKSREKLGNQKETEE